MGTPRYKKNVRGENRAYITPDFVAAVKCAVNKSWCATVEGHGIKKFTFNNWADHINSAPVGDPRLVSLAQSVGYTGKIWE